jgi:hypothetical protein
MARYTATLETPRTRRDVAAYLTDFATTQEWDRRPRRCRPASRAGVAAHGGRPAAA